MFRRAPSSSLTVTVNAALHAHPAAPGPARPTGFESRALHHAASWSFLLLVAALPWAIAPISISAGVCVALTLVMLFAPGALGRARSPVEWPALGWLVALTLAAAFALDPAPSFQRVPKGLLPLLVLLASFHARDPRLGRRALAVLLCAGALFAILGLVPFLARGAGIEGRARGMVGHYMTFAGQLLLVGSLAAGIVARASGRWRLGALAVALITSAALAATFTRSAWIGLLVALLIIVMATRPRWTPALLIAALAAIVVAPAPYRARALSAFDVHHPTNRERTFMWEGGLRMFRDRPLTGVGLQDMKPVYDRYKPAGARERAGHLHSVPVQIAASMGLVGLIAFTWLYWALVRSATDGLRPMLARGGLAAGARLGIAAGLAGFLVAGLFEWNFGDEELLYLLYTMVGIAWAARNWEARAA